MCDMVLILRRHDQHVASLLPEKILFLFKKSVFAKREGFPCVVSSLFDAFADGDDPELIRSVFHETSVEKSARAHADDRYD